MTAADEEAPSFTIEQRDQIDVYAGQEGHVVIKQTSNMGVDDTMILVHPDDVDKLIEYLNNAKIDATEIRNLKEQENA